MENPSLDAAVEQPKTKLRKPKQEAAAAAPEPVLAEDGLPSAIPVPDAPAIQPSLSAREAMWRRVRKIMEEDCQMVKGVFRNHECPGGSMTVSVSKYPGLHFNLTMEDGKEYEVPKYIARHLNGIDKASALNNGLIHSCQSPVHEWRVTKPGMDPHAEVGRWKQRVSFQQPVWSI